MRRLPFLVVLMALLIAIAGTGVLAQASSPSASAAPAAVTAPPPPPGPPAGMKPAGIRPVPSILPTLRLINTEGLPSLGFLLTLTDDQKTKAQDLLSKSDDELKPKVTAQVKATTDYIALLGKEASSEAELTTAAQKVMAADNDLMASRIKAFVAFKALLTPEQNKLLAQELQQTASRWLPQPTAPSGPPPAPANAK